jgi:insulysin
MSSIIREVVEDVVTSPEDKRSYRALFLMNNMKVLLVSDPSSDKAAAAMAVHVGQLDILRTIDTYYCRRSIY